MKKKGNERHDIIAKYSGRDLFNTLIWYTFIVAFTRGQGRGTFSCVRAEKACFCDIEVRNLDSLFWLVK